MKVIFSGLIVDARCKLGDVVASRNHYGTFFRVRRDTPPNNSPYWIAIRDQAEALSAEWRTLSEETRVSWNNAAKIFLRSDALGLPYYQTGLNFFVGNNINRYFCGDSESYTPPAPVAVPNFETLSLTANSSVPEKKVFFTPAITSAYKIKLFCTAALHAGIYRAFHQYRLLMMLDESFVSGSDIESDFVTRFLSSGPAGDKVFLKAIFVHRPSGLVGQAIYTNSIIV